MHEIRPSQIKSYGGISLLRLINLKIYRFRIIEKKKFKWREKWRIKLLIWRIRPAWFIWDGEKNINWRIKSKEKWGRKKYLKYYDYPESFN